jgi:hypothetical protein
LSNGKIYVHESNELKIITLDHNRYFYRCKNNMIFEYRKDRSKIKYTNIYELDRKNFIFE